MNNIEIFQAENGAIELRGDSSLETFWANLDQIAKLFNRDKSGISRHIKNIYESGELSKNSVVAIFATTARDGKTYQVEYYNLDMILSIGYRVDSREATQFRKWASSILKQYLINGYAINEKKLTQTKELLNNLKMTIDFLSTKEIGHEREILTLLKTYTKTLTLLENYDKNNIADISGNLQSYHLEYQEVKSVLAELKSELINKAEASQLFANEKADELSGIVANLYQTFGGKELYPTVEDKATHLLYFIIKDYPFNDGNKRSAAFLFIYFLDKCDYLYKSNGEKKINENALVTLTLLIANSNPSEKEILVKLIKHLIFEEQI
jgi:prophage maintenance system killer protein